jgi:(1->4)-alpha-D-glucan 1-alpha-D-glucosylmutase
MTTDPLAEVGERLLAEVAREVARRRLPEATYRLQFHKGFTFRDARAIVPYLYDLGISHCYASPYLQSRPGSMHGYDITNHQKLNAEIGTEEEYDAWVVALREHGMGHILDTVPNHMGVLGNENPWWNDVLENGPASPYAAYFDIAWQSSPRPELRDRLLVPILGDPYGQALESQQIRLEFADGAFTIHYFDNCLPVAPCSYALILSRRTDELKATLGEDSPPMLEYLSILNAVSHLPGRTEANSAKVAERQREKEVVKRRLAALTAENDRVREFIEQTIAVFNGKQGEASSFDLLDKLLDAQAYRLSYWRVASDEINYRRFFDINELAALSMERPEVFDATHDLIFRFLREGKIDGLRIDHPDGLYDPKQYLQRLQRRFALELAHNAYEARPEWQTTPWEEVRDKVREQLDKIGPDSPLWRPLYVVVEKILGPGEPLPPDWPVYGTSGYEFVNAVNDLFVDPENAQKFTRLYYDWGEVDPIFAVTVHQKKTLTLQVALSSELQMLAFQLDRLAQKNRWSRDFTLHSLRHALREAAASFPVYRSYISEEGVSDRDRRYVIAAVNRAKRANPAITASLFHFVRDMLLLRYPEAATEVERTEQRRFAGKFQQVTAPVMAKGVEDTAFYIYNRLASLNEVGGDPSHFGAAPGDLHRFFQDRQAQWPFALSPLATHDTKRGEDTRARLNVLSEIPDEWRERLARWRGLNEPYRIQIEDDLAPDLNEQYLLYQTLIGAWPLETQSAEEAVEFVGRIQTYMLKAIHEAKVHTSWVNPNKAYDDAVQEFVARILDEKNNGAFLEDFRAFQRRISHYGLFNSLSQTLLRLAAPGAPDSYQGTELWDFNLVDPDNRRPVDYAKRREMLGALRKRIETDGENLCGLAGELVEARQDGRIKLYVTHRALRSRRKSPGLFADGAYVPLEVDGPRKDHAFGFARNKESKWALVVVPRFMTRLAPTTDELPTGRVWEETMLRLPETASARRWRNVFTGEVLTPSDGQPLGLPLAAVFAHFPLALLVGEDG